MAMSVLSDCQGRVSMDFPRVHGEVVDVRGTLVEASLHGVAIGQMCDIQVSRGRIPAEVVGLRGHHVLLMPFGETAGIQCGSRIWAAGSDDSVGVGSAFLGRVIDALGRPLDGKGPVHADGYRPLRTPALPPFERRPVNERLQLGVRALDAMVPCGIGQRLGIFAGPGVGKSVLLGMIAKASDVDVVVLSLVGERGREVGHFVEEVLGQEGLGRAVVVVSTSDRSAPERVRAPLVATAIAEHFRDQGKNVLLFVDSLTRFCMAQREIGLAVGEPPTTKGYPPSAFAQLAPLVERVSPLKGGGSITALYTVLMEGGDINDPVADTVKGLLDGHIILSPELAARGHYPAIDVLRSLSRVEGSIANSAERGGAQVLRRWLARLDDAHDLIAVGAYQRGNDPKLDEALGKKDAIEAFLTQPSEEIASWEESAIALERLTGQGSANDGMNPSQGQGRL